MNLIARLNFVGAGDYAENYLQRKDLHLLRKAENVIIYKPFHICALTEIFHETSDLDILIDESSTTMQVSPL